MNTESLKCLIFACYLSYKNSPKLKLSLAFTSHSFAISYYLKWNCKCTTRLLWSVNFYFIFVIFLPLQAIKSNFGGFFAQSFLREKSCISIFCLRNIIPLISMNLLYKNLMRQHVQKLMKTFIAIKYFVINPM